MRLQLPQLTFEQTTFTGEADGSYEVTVGYSTITCTRLDKKILLSSPKAPVQPSHPRDRLETEDHCKDLIESCRSVTQPSD